MEFSDFCCIMMKRTTSKDDGERALHRSFVTRLLWSGTCRSLASSRVFVSIVRTSARSRSHASPRPQHVPNGVFHCSSYRSSAASYSVLEFGTRDSSFRRIFGSSAYASNRRFASSLNPSASPSFTRLER